MVTVEFTGKVRLPLNVLPNSVKLLVVAAPATDEVTFAKLVVIWAGNVSTKPDNGTGLGPLLKKVIVKARV